MRISSAYADFNAGLDNDDRRVLVADGVAYRDMEEVVHAFPHIGRTESAALFAEAWLRLHHGSGYQVIRDPADFRNRYQALAGRSRRGLSAAQSSAQYARYDVTEVSEPELRSDVLRCYVEDRRCGVPYRIEMPWPTHMHTVVEFLLLPLQDDEDDDYI